jgi:transposase
VGIDYHQNGVQVCVMDQSGRVLSNLRVANDWQAIVDRVHPLGTVQRAAIESCTGAAHLAEQLVSLAGWSVDLAPPGYVNRMKQNPDKSDYGDARMLADLVRVGYLPRVWLAPEAVRELRRLVRYRQQLVDQRRNIKLRISALLREQRVRCTIARPWTQAWLHWLQATDDLSVQGRWIVDQHLRRMAMLVEDIQAVEARLQDVTAADEMVLRLRQQSGVGWVTAWTMPAEIGRFDRFRSGKQLSRFCGLSPRNASSGERVADAGLIKAANGLLRATLIEAAHRLIRYDRRWADLADQLRRAGKPASVIAAAIGNRWIRHLYHQMKPLALAA